MPHLHQHSHNEIELLQHMNSVQIYIVAKAIYEMLKFRTTSIFIRIL